MSLEETFSKDITCLYAAKALSNYLIVQSKSKAIHKQYPTEQRFEELMEEYGIEFPAAKENQLDELINEGDYVCRKYGLTQNERDAFMIVYFAAIYLGMESGRNERYYFLEGITKEAFKAYLHSGLNEGVKILMQEEKTINPDFIDKAENWLLEEIYLRISNGIGFNFLNIFSMKDDPVNDNRIYAAYEVKEF